MKIIIPPRQTTQETNIFGAESNMFYNGDIKSIRLIGPPSETNRVNKMLKNEKINGGKMHIEGLKKYIKENDKISSNYFNFVDKNIMDDNDMILYYKAKRRQITELINEIKDREYNHQNKLSDITLNKDPKVSSVKIKDTLKKSPSALTLKRYII